MFDCTVVTRTIVAINLWPNSNFISRYSCMLFSVNILELNSNKLKTAPGKTVIRLLELVCRHTHNCVLLK